MVIFRPIRPIYVKMVTVITVIITVTFYVPSMRLSSTRPAKVKVAGRQLARLCVYNECSVQGEVITENGPQQ